MASLTSTIFGVHADALALRQQRLNLISSNLANVDTPGYKAQDLDFSSALRQAGAAPTGSGEPGRLDLRATESGSLPGGADIAEIGRRARFLRTELQSSLDGNTVDAQIEHAAFAKAALEYRVSLNFLEGRARSLMLAITGQ